MGFSIFSVKAVLLWNSKILDPRITSLGVRTFIAALGVALSEFKRLPLDDRDTTWILTKLRKELDSDFDHRLGSKDVCTLQVLSEALNLYIEVWDKNHDR